jgi:hypothetical protein
MGPWFGLPFYSVASCRTCGRRHSFLTAAVGAENRAARGVPETWLESKTLLALVPDGPWMITCPQYSQK